MQREEQEKKLALIKPFMKNIITPTTTLLDIGCGTGISLEPWNCEKVGIDPAQKLLDIAKKKGLDVQKAKAENLPFKNNSFDIVLAITSLHHTDFTKAIQEIARVTKKYFIFSLLKKSQLAKKDIKSLITPFNILEIKDSEKDMIYFTSKHI